MVLAIAQLPAPLSIVPTHFRRVEQKFLLPGTAAVVLRSLSRLLIPDSLGDGSGRYLVTNLDQLIRAEAQPRWLSMYVSATERLS